MANSSVAIVLLNYNGLELLQTFLPSVVENSMEIATVYIIDNASTDPSKDFVTSNFPNVKWIQLDQNFGFAKGYNLGLQQINAEYFILINSDVEVTANWIEPLLETLEKNPRIGAVQPKIKSYTDKACFEYAGASGGFLDRLYYPFCRGRIFSTIEEDNGQYNEAISCFWASGACFAVPKQVFHKVGGFDERFFMHMEEIDLCWRIQLLGYQIYTMPSSTVFHLGGGSLSYQSPQKLYFNIRNSLIMIRKNLSFLSFCKVYFQRLIFEKGLFISELFQGNFGRSFAILRGYASFWLQFFSWRNSFRVSHPKSKVKTKPYSIIVQYFLKKHVKYSSLPNES